jgi:hypothetical protein
MLTTLVVLHLLEQESICASVRRNQKPSSTSFWLCTAPAMVIYGGDLRGNTCILTTYSGDWKKLQSEAKLSDDDLRQFLNYAAQFIGNLGNYKSFVSATRV